MLRLHRSAQPEDSTHAMDMLLLPVKDSILTEGIPTKAWYWGTSLSALAQEGAQQDSPLCTLVVIRKPWFLPVIMSVKFAQAFLLKR